MLTGFAGFFVLLDWAIRLRIQEIVFALEAYILKLELEKISTAPSQGWHTNSWNVPYFFCSINTSKHKKTQEIIETGLMLFEHIVYFVLYIVLKEMKEGVLVFWFLKLKGINTYTNLIQLDVMEGNLNLNYLILRNPEFNYQSNSMPIIID